MATPNTKINQEGLVTYIQEYYDRIIQTQLQANYGRVYIDLGLESAPHPSQTSAALPPYHQNLYEKRLKELRDKISFDSFNQDVTNSSVIAHGTSNGPLGYANDVGLTLPSALSTGEENQPSSTIESVPEPEEDALVLISLIPISLHQGAGDVGSGGDGAKYKGKSLRLGRDVEFNDVIFAERPMTSLNIDPEYAQTCDYCLRPVSSMEEQVWNVLMAGEKTAKSTNGDDVLALLDQIAPFRDVISEYIYLSSAGDDDEDGEHQKALKDGKMTVEQYENIKKQLGEHYLEKQNQEMLLDFYQRTLLAPYNYTMRQLHRNEKSLVEAALTVGGASASTTAATTTSNSDANSVLEVQRAMYDLLEETKDDDVLDVNELRQDDQNGTETEASSASVLDQMHNTKSRISVFEPTSRIAEIPTPVYSPYNSNSFCSIRCACIAYNNYDHIFAHAYPRITLDQNGQFPLDFSNLGQFQTAMSKFDADGNLIQNDTEPKFVVVDDHDGQDAEDVIPEEEGEEEEDDDDNQEDGVGAEDDDDENHENDQNDQKSSLKLPPKDLNSRSKSFPLKAVPNTTKNTSGTITTALDVVALVPGQLTTSVKTVPGPSGLPFLHPSSLYQDLCAYVRGANPMFLQHVRAITQSISFWGMKLVKSLGGDYADIISLTALQSKFLTVDNSGVCVDLVNYGNMIGVHNYYLSQYHSVREGKMDQDGQNADKTQNPSTNSEDPEYDPFALPSDRNLHPFEDSITTQLETVMDDLESHFKSTIRALRNHHASFYQHQLTRLSSPSLPSSSSSSESQFTEEKIVELFGHPASDSNSLLTRCFCTECLSDLSYTLLQYAIFPYLMFTQSQWFAHVHDSKGEDFFTHLKNNPIEKEIIKTMAKIDSDPAPSASDLNDMIQPKHASLFRYQMELLHGLQDHFEPIIENYSRIISLYCSLITPLYPQCLRHLSSGKNKTADGRDIFQSPYFVDLLLPAVTVDPSLTLPIPYTSQRVRETMNDIPTRVQDYANMIQNPIDCCNWLVLSQFVSICEMNNIQIAPKSGVADLIEFFTVYNLVDLDPEDVEEAQEKMALMYKAAINVECRKNNIKPEQFKYHKDQFEPHLHTEEAYIASILSLCGKLNKKKPVAKAGAKEPNNQNSQNKDKNDQNKDQNGPNGANGDFTKAWSLLQKRGEDYPECSGLFRIGCTMNHSCDPNCTVYPLGDGRSNLVAIIALRDLKKGEELTISYIDDGLTYSQRQSELKDYQFQCACKRCVADKKRILLKKQQAAAKKAPAPKAAAPGTKPAPTGATKTTATATKTAAGKPGGAKAASKPGTKK